MTLVWEPGAQRVYLGKTRLATRFDSLIEVGHRLSEAEIAEIVESDAPVFVQRIGNRK